MISDAGYSFWISDVQNSFSDRFSLWKKGEVVKFRFGILDEVQFYCLCSSSSKSIELPLGSTAILSKCFRCRSEKNSSLQSFEIHHLLSIITRLCYDMMCKHL